MRIKFFAVVAMVGAVLILGVTYWLAFHKVGPPARPASTLASMELFENKEQIQEWAREEFGLRPTIFEYSTSKKALYIVVGSHSTGIFTAEIYVYVLSDDGPWRLAVLRYTNTSEVKNVSPPNSDRLILKSKRGKELLNLKVSDLNLDWDGAEQ